jgi:phosphate transport system permease protein
MSTVVDSFVASPADSNESRRVLRATPDSTDKIFRMSVRGSGIIVLAIMTMVGVFLLARASQALKVAGWSFFTTQGWTPDVGHGQFGIVAIITGTISIALVALVVAIPLAIGTALYISEYAPRKLRQTLISLVDLMAAVPSIVYGLWGAYFLQYRITGVSRWISTYFSWIPIFKVPGSDPHDPVAASSAYTSSIFIAGLVVGLMVTPIATSIMREAFRQAPVGEREGAYALGATRWGMIRSVVLPFGKGGVIGGLMLGLGRALGETIAVVSILSFIVHSQPHILANGGSSVSALIANLYGSASHFGTSAMFAAGLALFFMTLIVNFIASSIIVRSRSGASTDS